MSAIFQYVWPITDETRHRSELIAEASARLDDLATKHHAVITGPPLWDILPAKHVVGWEAWPGTVLICRAPADSTYVPPLRCHDVDQSEVDAARASHTVPFRAADRYALIRTLHQVERLDFATIAARLGMDQRTVEAIVLRKRRREPAAHQRTREAVAA